MQRFLFGNGNQAYNTTVHFISYLCHIFLLQTIGSMLLSAHYLMYGLDGIGLRRTKLMGKTLLIT